MAKRMPCADAAAQACASAASAPGRPAPPGHCSAKPPAAKLRLAAMSLMMPTRVGPKPVPTRPKTTATVNAEEAHAGVHHVLRNGEGRGVEDEQGDVRREQHCDRSEERGL